MASDKCLLSDISMKICKKCKKVAQSGPSCLACRSNFHAGCVKQLKHVEIIDEKSVNCCLIDGLQKNKVRSDINSEEKGKESSSDVIAIDNNDPSKLEIIYLKEILKQKDIIIDNLMDYIQTLKNHLIPTKNYSVTSSDESSNQKHSFKPLKKQKTGNEIELGKNQNGILKQRCTKNTNATNAITNENIDSIDNTVILKCEKSQSSPSSENNNDKTTRPQTTENKASKVRNIINRDISLAVLEEKTINKMAEYINLSDTNNAPDREWKQVKAAKSKRRPIVGSNSNTEIVKGVPKLIALHVSRLDVNTTTEMLKSLVQNNFKEVSVEEIPSRHPTFYKSFKVCIFEKNFKQALDPTLWPFGACISRFFEYRKKVVKEMT